MGYKAPNTSVSFFHKSRRKSAKQQKIAVF